MIGELEQFIGAARWFGGQGPNHWVAVRLNVVPAPWAGRWRPTRPPSASSW